MKAIVQDRYGSPDILKFNEIDRPTLGDEDVLVRVRAASVNTADRLVMRGLPYIMRGLGSGLGFGVRAPKHDVRGTDVAGEVMAVGARVAELQVGDEVFGESTDAFAEYASASASSLALKPANLTFEQAAAMPVAAITALQGIRDHGRMQPGQSILINGASGGVGTYAVQIGKALGGQVTGVCSTRNVDMVRAIGSDRVIDYTHENFTEGDDRYDVILDLVGNHSLSDRRRVLTSTGTLVLSYVGSNRWIGPLGQILGAAVLSPFVSQKVISFTARTTRDDLIVLKSLVEGGQVTPVIDRAFPLSEAAAAIGYLEQGHARGKVVLTVSADAGAA